MVLTKTVKTERILKSKVFIDSSVLIAAAISKKGTARDLLSQGLKNQFDLYISEEVLEECERNLSQKAPQALKDFYLFKKHLLVKLIKVRKSDILRMAKFIEVKDAPIVAGAVQAKADYLVSFDRKHLLQYKEEIEAYFKIKVVTPGEVIK